MDLTAMLKPACSAFHGKRTSTGLALTAKLLLIMKLTAILLLAAGLTASAHGHSQKVSLRVKDAPIEEVFSSLKKQTGYNFVYANDVLTQAKPVNLSISNSTLDEVLLLLFKSQPLSYAVVDKVVVVKVNLINPKDNLGEDAVAQPPIDVIGRVTDSTGKPMQGATVKVRGSNKQTTTDANGFYTLKAVADDAVLEISYVGFETIVIKASNSNANNAIILKAKETSLSDIIITAPYGQEKRKRETGYAVTKIGAEELTQTHSVNVLNALAGKVPSLNLSTTTMGVNPQINILLRGIRTLGGDNTPMFVIDGTEMTFGGGSVSNINRTVVDLLSSINPNDIEDITVLRGANATTLYGPQGVNGVIVINTKKGTTGRVQINFSHSTNVQSLDKRYPKLQKTFGSGSAKNAFGDGIYNPVDRYSWGPAFTGGDSIIGRVDEFGNYQRVPYSYSDNRFDFLEHALTVQNDLSFNGGDRNSHFFVALGYANITGLIPGDELKRYVLRTNADRTFGKFKAAVNFSLTRTNQETGSGASIITDVISTPAQIPLTKYKDFKNDHWSNHNNYYSDYLLNPYEEAATTRSKAVGYSFFGNFSLTANLLKWLTVTNRVGLNYNNRESRLETQQIIYSDFSRLSGRLISGSDRQASLASALTSTNAIINDLLLTAQKQLSNFKGKILLGSSIKETNSGLLQISTNNLSFPGVFNFGLLGSTPDITDAKYKTRSTSLFANISLAYKDWAFIEISGRNDNDSRVSDGKGGRSYYGANASIVITDALNLLKNNPTLSYARFRIAWNKTANFNSFTHNGERVFVDPIYPFGNFPYGALSSVTIAPNFTSKDLSPERIYSQEYGIEVDFWKDVLKFDVNYYTQLNDGMILSKGLPFSTGYSGTTLNLGKFRNKGWELEITAKPFERSVIRPIITGYFSINDNKVIELYKGRDEYNLGNAKAVVGGIAFLNSFSDWSRDSLGRVIINPITGLPSTNPVPRDLGRTMPKYIGGLSLNIPWKELTLSINAEYRSNYYKIFSNAFDLPGISILSAINGRERFVFPNSVYWDGSKYVENKDIVVNSAHRDFLGGNFRNTQSNYYASAAFWKIRDIVLGYDLPISKWLGSKRSFFKNASISVFGRNLFNFYPKTNLWGDPELTGTAFGSKFYGCNINVSF